MKGCRILLAGLRVRVATNCKTKALTLISAIHHSFFTLTFQTKNAVMQQHAAHKTEGK